MSTNNANDSDDNMSRDSNGDNMYESDSQCELGGASSRMVGKTNNYFNDSSSDEDYEDVRKRNSNTRRKTSPTNSDQDSDGVEMEKTQDMRKKNSDNTIDTSDLPVDSRTGFPFRSYIPSGSKDKEKWSFCQLIPNDDVVFSTKLKLGTKDAKGFYCKICHKAIAYTAKTNDKAVKRHLVKEHKKEIEVLKEDSPEQGLRKKLKETIRDCSQEEQVVGEFILATWIGESLRPFSLVEDEGFRRFVKWLVEVQAYFREVSRRSIGRRMKQVCKLTDKKIRQMIHNELEQFCCTSDIWTNRSMDSYIALTLHGLTVDFEKIDCVLAVEYIPERHTGDHIKNRLDGIFQRWGLLKCRLTILVRDNGSDIKKACKLWNCLDLGCVAHGLHLVVGPLFFVKNGKKEEQQVSENASDDNEKEKVQEKEAENESDDEDKQDDVLPNGTDNNKEEKGEGDNVCDYDEAELEAELKELQEELKTVMKEITEVVQLFRTFSKYCRKSTVAKDKLKQFLKSLDIVYKTLELDVRTRWNSTIQMLKKILELRKGVDLLSTYSKTPAGKKQFRNKNLPSFTEYHYCTIAGIVLLLRYFEIAVKMLSGETNASFVSALPMLQKIRTYLDNKNFFYDTNDKHVAQFHKEYADFSTTQFEGIVSNLDMIRELMLEKFDERFESICTPELIWTSALDPRWSNLKHLIQDERDKAISTLVNKVSLILREKRGGVGWLAMNKSLDDSEREDEDEFLCGMGNNSQSTTSLQSPQYTSSPPLDPVAEAREEVYQYMAATRELTYRDTKPLTWWKDNRSYYPNIAVLARRWLAAPATSVPSERTFSTCGIANQPIRNRLSPEYLEYQVKMNKNRKLVTVSETEMLEYVNTTK